MRRTVSNLSRELNVSRPRIYRAIERLGIEKKAGGEFLANEWEALKQELQSTATVNRQKQKDAEKPPKIHVATENEKCAVTTIASTSSSTLQARLNIAKQEYDYNRGLISVFQMETDAYVAINGRTTMMSHNGSLSPIPSVANIEKYGKLNIALSKHISDLESDLDLSTAGEDDPFAQSIT